MNANTSSLWQQWLYHPQRLWLRRALFQVHLWCGIGLGLYIFLISITGSVLVYRNELYVAATLPPQISREQGPLLDDAALAAAAFDQYPEHVLVRLSRAGNPDQAVELWLQRGDEVRQRLFDPHTGADLGDVVSTGFHLVTKLITLHDDLLAGPMGRKVNGIGAICVLVVALTGLVLWWPGRSRWRRSLVLHRGVGPRRLIWDLHGVCGFWSSAAIFVFAFSGAYLCFPESFHALADRLEPMTEENAGNRPVDTALYWLAFSHFGRINGIGLFCDGPGLCDQATKALWALFGLAPAAMFVTGALMWWNRVLRRWLAGSRRP